MAETFTVYQNGAKFKEGITALTETVSKLSPETEYNFQVSRVLDGVESELSEPLAVTTLAQAISVTGVTVAPKNATGTSLEAGSKQFTATVAPSDATVKDVTFTIAPTKEGVTITNKGLVSWTEATGLAGEYTITAKTKDGNKTDTGKLTLTDKVTGPAG